MPKPIRLYSMLLATASSVILAAAAPVVYRTPESAFNGTHHLWPYTPHYHNTTVQSTLGPVPLRIAYYIAGPSDSEDLIVLNHGGIPWSLLWYTTIPGLIKGGAQVIAVDLPGFGRSDKPVLDTERDAQTYNVLGDAITDWFGKVVVPLGENRRVTVVGQDWGGWTALRSIAAHPSAVAGHVSINAPYLGVSNFSISCKNAPPGEGWFVAAAKSTEAMLNWQRWMKKLKAPDAGDMMEQVGSPAFRLTVRNLTVEEKAAFNAPMLKVSFYSVLYAMPTWLDDLIFESPDKSPGRARDDQLFRDVFAPGKPGAHIAVLTLGSNENFDRPAAYQIQCVYPGAAGQPHHEYARGEASHYSPMDVGPDMAQRILNFTRTLPMPTL